MTPKTHKETFLQSQVSAHLLPLLPSEPGSGKGSDPRVAPQRSRTLSSWRQMGSRPFEIKCLIVTHIHHASGTHNGKTRCGRKT